MWPETFLKCNQGIFIGWLISGCTFILQESSHHSYTLPLHFPPPSVRMRWESLLQLKTRNSLCHPPLSRCLFQGGAAAPVPVPDQSKICWFQKWCNWYCLVCSLLHTGPSRHLTSKDTASRERKRHLLKTTTTTTKYRRDSWGMLVVKDPPANAWDVRDASLIPGSGRSPGERNGNPLQCSCLENPRDGGAWWVAISGVAESDTTEVT